MRFCNRHNKRYEIFCEECERPWNISMQIACGVSVALILYVVILAILKSVD